MLRFGITNITSAAKLKGTEIQGKKTSQKAFAIQAGNDKDNGRRMNG